MSLSHASPEELLPEAPESQLSGPEAQPSAAIKPRQRLPFGPRKILQTGSVILLTFSLAGSLIALVVMGSQVSDLTIRVNTLDAAFRSGQIGQLTSNVSAMENRLKTLEQQVATLTDLPGTVQTTRDQLDSLKSAVNQLRDNENTNSQAVAQLMTRAGALEHDVQQAKAIVDELNRRTELAQKPSVPEKPRTVIETEKNRTASASKKINRSVRRAVTLAAPFELTGIERRGGQTFAVVIPRGASQISSMRLLSPGDSLMGWTLKSTEGGHAARFQVNGIEQLIQAQ